MNRLQENALIVLDNIKKLIIDNPDDVEEWSSVLEEMLDDLHGTDFFGTEGQNDPRGDFRDGQWSLYDEVQKNKDM